MKTGNKNFIKKYSLNYLPGRQFKMCVQLFFKGLCRYNKIFRWGFNLNFKLHLLRTVLPNKQRYLAVSVIGASLTKGNSNKSANNFMIELFFIVWVTWTLGASWLTTQIKYQNRLNSNSRRIISPRVSIMKLI